MVLLYDYLLQLLSVQVWNRGMLSCCRLWLLTSHDDLRSESTALRFEVPRFIHFYPTVGIHPLQALRLRIFFKPLQLSEALFNSVCFFVQVWICYRVLLDLLSHHLWWAHFVVFSGLRQIALMRHLERSLASTMLCLRQVFLLRLIAYVYVVRFSLLAFLMLWVTKDRRVANHLLAWSLRLLLLIGLVLT